MDVAGADGTARTRDLAALILLAVVIKTLVDKGVITDAELNTTLDAARDDAYEVEATKPAAPTDPAFL